MNEYILNANVLCFTQDVDNEEEILIIEKDRKFNITDNCFRFMKRCCLLYGHSYNIQRQLIIDIFNYYIKTPILLSISNNILFFPTSSPNSKDCIWISYNNIDRYVRENDYTKIYFKGGKIINISVPYNTIDNQITRCIKIEKYLSNKTLIN